MGCSMVLMVAMAAKEDIVVIDPNLSKVMLFRHCNGKSVILGRLPGTQQVNAPAATAAKQLSALQGNIWNRRSVACAVGGVVSRKGKWSAFFTPKQRKRVAEQGLYLWPSCLATDGEMPIKKDLLEVVYEHLLFVKVVIHEPQHWSWAMPNPRLTEAGRLGRFPTNLLDCAPREKAHCRHVRGLSVLAAGWWGGLNTIISACVGKPAMEVPVRTCWWHRQFLVEEVRWGCYGLPPTKTETHPRLHYDTGVKSLLAAVRAGLNRCRRPASRTLLREMLVRHLVDFRWLSRTVLGPIDEPRSDALLLLEGSVSLDAEGRALTCA
jgi:hypothetical protein